VIGHDESQHGVAEELQALVRFVAGILRAPAAVRQRCREVGLVGERRTESLVQNIEASDRKQLVLTNPIG
jgi:hypothetical protein